MARRPVMSLVACLAVVFGTGVVAAAAVRFDGSTTVVAGPAGLSEPSLVEDPVPSTTSSSTTAVSVARPTVPSTSTTVARPVVTTSTTSTTVAPSTSTRPTTTTTTVPVPSRWSGTDRELTVTVRMEPAAPVAGVPVRFVVEASDYPGCCLGAMAFGDESGTEAFNLERGCLQPRSTKAVVTHTYAEPGAYQASVSAVVLPCSIRGSDDGVAYWAQGRSVTSNACVGVGPGPEARACVR